jgi:hypothetical protein
MSSFEDLEQDISAWGQGKGAETQNNSTVLKDAVRKEQVIR